jgi:hypothetical protein
MFKVTMETAKIGEITNMIGSVQYGLRTNAHINDLITATHKILADRFIMHMSNVAFNSPEEFKHMYEWGRVGDPNGRLWKHLLRGAGAARVATFDFKASKKTVPLTPEKQAVGVKNNHIFVWKAPILELGLPVRISPKIATTLVMDYPKRTGQLVYTKRTIYIPRQGSEQAWGAFTNEFMRWFAGGTPIQIIKSEIEPKIQAGVREAMRIGILKMKGKVRSKNLTITPVGIDKNFVTTMNQAMRINYIEAARNRLTDG